MEITIFAKHIRPSIVKYDLNWLNEMSVLNRILFFVAVCSAGLLYSCSDNVVSKSDDSIVFRGTERRLLCEGEYAIEEVEYDYLNNLVGH